MIQRIQSIYLALAFICNGVLPFLLPLFWVNGEPEFVIENIGYVVLNAFSASLSIISLFSFKKRKNQFVFGRLNIILNFILLGLFIARLLNVSGGENTPVKGIGVFLPIVSIVLLSLANRAVKKDENLVKSADRLR
ncbi:hypothetical protein AM493_02475 [Flavobacterium akiainvivens]|uniref:Transcription termination factor Rho n=1 Tax=Flavobacterium akiainvivens TaxID=1202724 RepID=A0A0M8M904_9FLAO|nr:DUF4293 domain-containing protein [Flavobacterium akiainvivens]KOS05025.1 hypothetical protein AM493_02475 [Flavobacterium akiainvivens]SFQ40097.1 protein of unknown function [Flavobacterium akiainvivens]